MSVAEWNLTNLNYKVRRKAGHYMFFNSREIYIYIYLIILTFVNVLIDQTLTLVSSYWLIAGGVSAWRLTWFGTLLATLLKTRCSQTRWSYIVSAEVSCLQLTSTRWGIDYNQYKCYCDEVRARATLNFKLVMSSCDKDHKLLKRVNHCSCFPRYPAIRLI